MKKLLLLIYLTTDLLILNSPVFAQCTGTGFNLRDCYFNSHPGAKNLGTNPGSLLGGFLPNIFLIAGICLLIVTVIAGFFLIQDAGTDVSAQDLAKRKAIFSSALIGFLLVVSSYLILYLIGIITGINFLNPPI